MSADEIAPPGRPQARCAVALVAIAILTPWLYGGVEPMVIRFLTALGLLVAMWALVAGAARGALWLPALPLWPWASVIGLGLLQLVPLPGSLHRVLAPGSWEIWHPREPAVALVLGTVARPISIDPQTTLEASGLLAALALLAVLAAPVLAHRRAARRAVLAVALGGLALAAYAILARARFGALLYGRVPVPTTNPFGPFVNKNHFAGWSAMAALLVIGLVIGLVDDARRRGYDWTTRRRAVTVVLAVVAALAMALAVLASLSRGGVIALVVGAVFFVSLQLAESRGRSRTFLASLTLVAVLAVILVSVAPPDAHERLRSMSGHDFRLDTWRDTLRLGAASPLVGHGLGAFHDAYPRFKRGHGTVRVEHAENEYLEMWAETGTLGLAMSLIGLAWIFRTAGPTAPGHDRLLRGVASGGLAALVALAAHSVLDFDLRIPSNAALAALAAAAAAAGVRSRPLSRRAAVVLALVACALLVAVLSQPYQPWLATWEETRRAALSRAAPARALRLERAEAALVAQLRRRPAHAESWLLLSGVRRARGDTASAAALARYATWLDPRRPELREAARQLGVSPPAGGQGWLDE